LVFVFEYRLICGACRGACLSSVSTDCLTDSLSLPPCVPAPACLLCRFSAADICTSACVQPVGSPAPFSLYIQPIRGAAPSSALPLCLAPHSPCYSPPSSVRFKGWSAVSCFAEAATTSLPVYSFPRASVSTRWGGTFGGAVLGVGAGWYCHCYLKSHFSVP